MSGDIEGAFIFVVPHISSLTRKIRFSEVHNIGNIPWKISVKTSIVENVERLSIYSYCNSDNDSPIWKVEARRTFKVLSNKIGIANVKKTSSIVHSSTLRKRGSKSFMKWDDLMDPNKGYVKDDSIQVQAFIIITKVVGLPSFGYNFQKSSDFLDVAVIVDRRKLHVNKAYLSAVSPVLKTLLSSNNSTRFEIKDVKYSEFLVFLAAVHHTPSTINAKNVEFLLKLAKRFEAAPAMYQCEQFLLSSEDFTLTKKFLLADKYCLSELHDSCTKSLKIPDIKALKIDEGYKNLTSESKDVLLESMLKIVETMKEA